MRIFSTCLVAAFCLMASTPAPAASPAPASPSASSPSPNPVKARAAYVLKGSRWPRGVVRYRSALRGDDRQALKMAVRAWNSSGARVRFVRARSRSQIRLRIGYSSMRRPWAGQATLGYVAPGSPVYTPTGGRAYGAWAWIQPPSRQHSGRGNPWSTEDVAGVIAHELGHVLGLDHTRGCSIMSYSRHTACDDPPAPWFYRCRLIEPDDVRGLIRRYGGRSRLGEEFCEHGPAPLAPHSLNGSVNDDGTGNLSWVTPSGSANQIRIEQRNCAADSPNAQWYTRTRLTATPGNQSWHDPYLPSYRMCYRLRSEDQWGRESDPSPQLLLDSSAYGQ